MVKTPENDPGPTPHEGRDAQAARADSQAGGADVSVGAPQSRTVSVPPILPLWNNVITVAGVFLAAMALLLLLTFGLFSVVSPAANPYVGIVGYLILPGVMIVGLVLMPIGILVKSWRVKREDPTQHLAFRFPRIDLTDPAQRRVAKVFVIGTFVLLPVVGVSAYHGYHYTDSTDFCGRVCHSVMRPQATTYEHSPHARVSCAECHIGSGASWFVKSKLSGLRQVVATWRDTYSRPIPPAITELRPARETCEQCHWPKKFYGAQLREIMHFSSDEKNTPHEVNMLLKIGGGDDVTGRAEGIHLHMALSGRIEYIATDERLQEIPWVRYVDEAGTELMYRSDGRPSSDPKPEGIVRRIDCMDCHNRPAHKFRSPQESIDILLDPDVGRIDATLPYIKREAVTALLTPYPDDETAMTQIGVHLISFYREHYPEVWKWRSVSVNNAVDEVRKAYARSFFPEMKVDWNTYPDNIGHFIYPGCFRCHDGRHVNQRGEYISHDCGACHAFLNPIEKNAGGAMIQEGAFIHPFELQGSHTALRCDQCHSGGPSPSRTCAGCHESTTAFRAGRLRGFDEMSLPADPMAGSVDCESCHDLSKPTTIMAIDTLCMECHEDEEEKYTGMLASWKEEMDRLMKQAQARASTREEARLLEALRGAGPLHNMEASRTLLRSVGSSTAGENDDDAAQ